MKITELLKQDTILLDVKSTTKTDVIHELVDVLEKGKYVNDSKAFTKAIFDREEQSTTGIGEGVAIPHAKTSAVITPTIVFGRSVQGVDYESLDGQPAHLFFMIAATDGANSLHLDALSRLSTILMNEEARQALRNASTKEEVIKVIDSYEEAKAKEENETISSSATSNKR